MSFFTIFISLSLLIFVIFCFILYIFIIIDILKHEFTGYNKIIWIIVILCFPILGAILYLFIGRKQRIKEL
ncbi:PLDc N-terminal domain-containing protein [Aliarcobacter butzleri]|uniref:PLDc N-terminal domain-containing protein n=1 Tax=Aliarcobacter butzleri TaxID=28197 RepID=UPI001EDACD34|nr:PLDc N-terminal domain-containing protein [Aliarcobacter butzleri]MCG3675557.1 PLDc N-terminal domain-containing protein [Aliarcobacter butzleri]MCG3684044.1 PLDc N-terminal domain-containing protein [Aliarcobacter butzleri]MCG3688157.1 PLDc N-terminal domain-containing protein [Aliarcobacter butzleri]MCG3695331.1 PLDc N-terminal domain-containing protein [Aliarcobacter butzleri]MCG3703582.1 PLDc N-terminal domain-containing protein [Aliarcobacter butzleri]